MSLELLHSPQAYHRGPIQDISHGSVHWQSKGLEVHIQREDLVFPELSGNKWRKLRYNLEEAVSSGHRQIISFGGAFSNHIHALAHAGSKIGLKTIGVIRGEELADQPLNPTLQQAASLGMQLVFVSRKEYDLKSDPGWIAALPDRWGKSYVLPEGGNNDLAVRGCAEILGPESARYSHIAVAVGTGGTLSGLLQGSHTTDQKILGFWALKGMNSAEEVRIFGSSNQGVLLDQYHWGGYAKFQPELIEWINRFYQVTQVPLDPIYTGKVLCGIEDLARKGWFSPKDRILVIHTGGLQGNAGFNQRCVQQKLPTLTYEI